MQNRGQFSQFSIFTWIITAFLVVVFFAGLIYVMGQLNDVFHQVGVLNDQNPPQNTTMPCIDNASNLCVVSTYVNLTLASDQIWGNAYQSIQALRMVAIVYILALGCAIVIVGFLERKHPFLFFVYILLVLLAVIFAPTVSNAYENLLTTNIFGGELNNFSASNVIILNLPIFVLVIGIAGGIGLFIHLVRNQGEELS